MTTKRQINLNFSVGTALRTERLKREMTQQQVADLAGFTREEISMLETGKRVNNIDTLSRVSNAVGQPLWKIIKKSEELEAQSNEEILADVAKLLGKERKPAKTKKSRAKAKGTTRIKIKAKKKIATS